MLPSTNSTKEWMVDWGCTITETCSGGKLNKRQASMTSNPLFIRVAESMVMRLPIFQVGWFSARCPVINFYFRNARGFQPQFEIFGVRLRSYRDEPWAPALRLLKSQIEIASSGKRDHLKTLRK